jgi:eukaryotic-like serine/threonine-protein kinase
MAAETDILPPRYRNPKRIGRGGMGEIYHATDRSLGRPVAVKVLADRFAEDDAVRNRFTREALAAARLSGDPNTVTIFDVGEWNERPFIVMEYLAGGSLEDVLREGGAQEPGQALEWLEQAGRALDTAHQHEIVHRDVKPANLILNRAGEVHVADFGIASATGMDSLTKPGTVLGTAGYLSPEQASGERSTPASDRYALAVVGFELLSGSRPFESESPTAEAAAHVHAEIPSISSRRPELPTELDPAFQRALAKEPAARYPSCAELVAALRRALSEAAGATTVLPVVAPQPGPPPVQRTRRLWPLLVGGLLAAALAGVGLAAALTGDGEEQSATPTVAPPSTIVRTVATTLPGTTDLVTITAAPPQTEAPPETEAPPPEPVSGASGAELNDQGFRLMQAGDYASALPLLAQSVQKLRGSGELAEAYASYNLAFTRLQLGQCGGVVKLLDRSEAVQGHRREIEEARAQASRSCDGGDGDE